MDRNFTAIAAMDRNRGIGIEGKMPWHLSEDLKRFSDLTRGQIVIMGRKTFESIGSSPLPNRMNIVISRDSHVSTLNHLRYVQSVADAIGLAIALTDPTQWDRIYGPCPVKKFVIGGEAIFREFFYAEVVNRMLLTEIDDVFGHDTEFPEFDPNDWTCEKILNRNKDHEWAYADYKRKPAVTPD